MLHDMEMKIGWGKAVPLPPVPLYSGHGVPTGPLTGASAPVLMAAASGCVPGMPLVGTSRMHYAAQPFVRPILCWKSLHLRRVGLVHDPPSKCRLITTWRCQVACAASVCSHGHACRHLHLKDALHNPHTMFLSLPVRLAALPRSHHAACRHS